MTTTMPGMGIVIDKLKEFGLRDKVKIMVGGAPVSPAFAKKIGADGYTSSAIEAVDFAKNLVEAYEEKSHDGKKRSGKGNTGWNRGG